MNPRRLVIAVLAVLLSGAALAQHRVQVMLEESPPYSFADANGLPNGYSVDLARELLARAKLVGVYEFSSWPRVARRGLSEPDVLLPAIVRLSERESQFHWIGQIGIRRGSLFRLKSRPDVQPRTLAEARAFRTAVIKDDVSERELLALGWELGAQLDRSADYPALLRKFFAGRTELLAVNQALAATVLKQYGYDPQLIEPVLKFSESKPSIAISLPTDAATVQVLQQAWDSMRKDGSLAAIAARYPMISLD